MANEAVIVEAPKWMHRRTVADNLSISKGTILKLADPNTASASADDADVFGGILMVDKLASDGQVSVPVADDSGVFDIKCNESAGITAGAVCAISGANLIRAAVAANLLTGAAFGIAEETASVNEVIRVRLGGR